MTANIFVPPLPHEKVEHELLQVFFTGTVCEIFDISRSQTEFENLRYAAEDFSGLLKTDMEYSVTFLALLNDWHSRNLEVTAGDS